MTPKTELPSSVLNSAEIEALDAEGLFAQRADDGAGMFLCPACEAADSPLYDAGEPPCDVCRGTGQVPRSALASIKLAPGQVVHPLPAAGHPLSSVLNPPPPIAPDGAHGCAGESDPEAQGREEDRRLISTIADPDEDPDVIAAAAEQAGRMGGDEGERLSDGETERRRACIPALRPPVSPSLRLCLSPVPADWSPLIVLRATGEGWRCRVAGCLACEGEAHAMRTLAQGSIEAMWELLIQRGYRRRVGLIRGSGTTDLEIWERGDAVSFEIPFD